jgi:hypothetical protein
LDDANPGIARPRLQGVVVGRREADGVEAALRVHELRLETRQVDHREPITVLAVDRPAIELQLVLPEVAVDVVVRVDLREIDPGLVAGVRVGRRLDVHADLGEREFVAAGEHVAADDREAQGTDRGHDRAFFRAGREIDEERAGVNAELDLQTGLRGSGLGFGGRGSDRCDLRGIVRGNRSGGLHTARDRNPDHARVDADERGDQAACKWQPCCHYLV